MKKFHATHYHPTNACFFTYGDMPLNDHLQHIDEKVLSSFDKGPMSLDVPLEKRWQEPVCHIMFVTILQISILQNKLPVQTSVLHVDGKARSSKFNGLVSEHPPVQKRSDKHLTAVLSILLYSQTFISTIIIITA